MIELVRTNDVVYLSWLEAILRERGIEPLLLDTHASVIEGSIGAIPRRLMVADEDAVAARRLIADMDPAGGG